MARKFLRGLQYTTGTNGRDIPIFMKLAYEFWSYCVNGTNPFITITSATNANPIQITTSTPHNLQTNQFIGVYGVQGNTNANGGWTVIVVNATTFTLNGAVGNQNYISGGIITVPGGIPINPISLSGQVQNPQGFFEGSSVLAVGTDGVTSSIGGTVTAASSLPFSTTMIGKHIVLWAGGASTGISTTSAGLTLPQVTLNVGNTIGFPTTGGIIYINTSTGIQTVSYTTIANTTIGAASNTQTLPQSVINVASTGGFPSSGFINIVTSFGPQIVAYTGTSGGNQFTGCTGGLGTMSTGGVVQAPQFTNCGGGTGVMSLNGSVTQQPPSTDDSIYRIIAVPSTSQIQVVPFSGGTPDVSTLKNNLTSRAALNYRVIDVIAASQLTVANGNYWIGNFSGAPNVNNGQNVSQFQFFLRGASATFGNFGIVASPNGSWNGTAFSGIGSNTTMTERITGTGTTFSQTTANVNGFITIIADTDFIIAHIRSPNSNITNGYYFYVVTPLRLYTQLQDPNLIAVLVGANNLTAGNATDSHSTAFYMVGTDGVTRNQQLMTRNLAGDTANASIGLAYTIGPALSSYIGFQGKGGQVLFGDALIASNQSGQFYLSRSKMRPLEFATGALPAYTLVGNSGEFIHVANGVLWPWDGAILPYNLLQLGT